MKREKLIDYDDAVRMVRQLSEYFNVRHPLVMKRDSKTYEGMFFLIPVIAIRPRVRPSTVVHEFLHYLFYVFSYESDLSAEHRFMHPVVDMLLRYLSERGKITI
jgi:hypothetical protein